MLPEDEIVLTNFRNSILPKVGEWKFYISTTLPIIHGGGKDKHMENVKSLSRQYMVYSTDSTNVDESKNN